MNKKIITLGVAAIGVAGVQAADAGKVWEVTASSVSYTHLTLPTILLV